MPEEHLDTAGKYAMSLQKRSRWDWFYKNVSPAQKEKESSSRESQENAQQHHG